nr:Uma2 family endonuclease [Oceanobacillus salinisoli]
MLPKTRNYSYADYLTWNEGGRIELIDGKIFNMSPAPSFLHNKRDLTKACSIWRDTHLI